MKIHKQPQPTNRISWPDLYFAAEANREPFQDIVIVTTSEHEYVKVEADEISVGIKSDISDDTVLYKALDMVAEALSTLNGQPGVVYFGDTIQLVDPTSTNEFLH